MKNKLDEFYVIRVRPAGEHFGNGSPKWTGTFVSSQGTLSPFAKARQFSTLEEADAYIDEQNDNDRWRFSVQFCTRGRTAQQPAKLQGIIGEIMKIPHPYRRTAYNWICGRDVKARLMSQSIEVFERHRRMLLQHGIDIEQRSTVVLMKRPRRRIRINAGTSAGGSMPRQYFIPRSQRPRPLTDEP